jgi:hypothetical protein
MNQPLFNVFRSGICKAGKQGTALWFALVAMVFMLASALPSQAQVSIRFENTSTNTLFEGNEGTVTYNFRISVSGGGNDTYRVPFRTLEGPIAAASGGANSNRFWATYSGNLSQRDFNERFTFVDVNGSGSAVIGITIYGDTHYEDDEYFNVQVLDAFNISNPRNAPLQLLPNPAFNQAEALIRNDDATPNLSINVNPDKGPQTSPGSCPPIPCLDYADSFVPEFDGVSNDVTLYVTANRINGKGSTGTYDTTDPENPVHTPGGGANQTFRYFTSNGTAQSGTDFSPVDTPVTIPFNTQTLAGDVTDPGTGFINRGANFAIANNIAPNVTVTAPTVGDTEDEGDESINFTLQGVTNGNAVIDPNSATRPGTIQDDDAPSASILDASVTEGDSGLVQITFPIVLSGPSPQAVQIDYRTIDNSALSENNGSQVETVTFSNTPASGSYRLGVSYNGSFYLETSDIPFNADATAIRTALLNIIIPNTGGVRLLDPTDIISVDVVSNVITIVFRARQSRTFGLNFNNNPNPNGNPPTAPLRDSSGTPVTATILNTNTGLTLAANFERVTGRSVVFAPGETTKTVSVNVVGNTIPEGEDGQNRFLRFFVEIFVDNNGFFIGNPPNPTMGVEFNRARATGTINDDDLAFSQLRFDQDLVTREGNLTTNGQPQVTTADFVVELTQPTGLSASVNYATSDGTAKGGATGTIGTCDPVNTPQGCDPTDYRSTSGTLKFAPGETSKIVSVPVFGDNLDERDETFFLNLSNPSNATILNGQARDLILDDDGPFVDVSDVPVTDEGDSGPKAFNFIVSLSAPSPQAISVLVNTTDGTAIGAVGGTGLNSQDYRPEGRPAPLRVNFAPGDTSKTVTVLVEGDIRNERDETFRLDLVGVEKNPNDPTNTVEPATIRDSQGIATIRNDDDPPFISINDVSLLEGNGGQTNFVFTVQLSAATFQTVSFNYATANGTATTASNDYVQRSGQLTFAPDETSKTITVPVVGDGIREPDPETFFVDITNVVNADAGSIFSDTRGQGSIGNDDEDPAGVTITPTSLTTSEAGTSDTFTVRLNRQPTADVMITFTSGKPSEGLLSVGNGSPQSSVTLTFTQQNYTVAQTVRVTGQDDTLVDGQPPYSIISENVVSADQLYSGINPVDITVVNTDDEVPGFQVTPTTLTVSETGTTATFTVRLNVASTSDVTVPVSSSNTSEATVSPTTLTFTPQNGTQPQIVTVTGVDDAVKDGDRLISIVLGAATSGDNRYAGLDPQDVRVTVTDNETPGILVTPTSGLQTTEAGGTATFTIQLTSPPTAPVTIALSSNDTSEGTVSPSSVTFNNTNFNVAQTITVRGVNDAADDDDQAYKVITAGATSADADYNTLNAPDVDVTNLDDEVPGFIVTPDPLTVNENAGTFSFTVRLSTAPTADVTVPVLSEQPGVADVSPTTLTFTQNNFSVPQTVRLTITDNRIDDGDKDFNILLGLTNSQDVKYDRLSKKIPITVVDNDTAGIVIAPTGNRQTTEATGTGRTTSFTIKLNSAPTGSVTINLSSSNTAEGTVSPASLTFDSTNFDTPRQVTVTGVDDDVDDENVIYFIRTDPAQSSDANYNGMNAVDVAVTSVDNDTFGITINPTSGLSIKERGQSATFTVVLTSQPLNTVNFTLTSNDTTEGVPRVGTAPPGVVRLFFTAGNWNVPQTVTVNPVDDLVDDGDQTFTIVTGAAVANGDRKYNGLNPADVQVKNTDDDTAGLSVVPASPTSNGLFTTREAGARVSFLVKLLSQPTSNVTVAISTSDTTEGQPGPAVTFTPASYDTQQRLYVDGVDDTVEDGHINYTINVASTVPTGGDANYSGQSVPGFAARNLDNDDNTKPNVAITSPTANQVFRSITRVSGIASDAKDPASFFVSGVVKVEVQLVRYDDPTTPASEVGYYNSEKGQFELPRNTATTNNPQLLPATYNASRQAWVANLPQTGTNSLAEGSYALVAFATDGKGNRQTSSAVNFRVDMTPPVVAITTPADGATLNTLPQARGTATDVGGSGINRVEVTVIRQANNTNGLTFGYLAKDGSFTSTFTVANNRLPATLSGSNWTVNLPTLPRATYTITAYAFDNGGIGSAPDTHRFTITGTNEFAGNTGFLISIPYMDGASVNATTTPTKAFTVPPTDPTTGRVNYRLQRYNPLTMDWETLGNGSTLRRGEGYLLTPVASGVSIKRPSDDPTRIPLDSSVQEFQVTLRNQPSLAPDADGNGWNLIGDPFNPALFSSAEWLTARVTANIGGQTFTGTVAEAADRGILDRRLFNYNPSAATSGGSLYTPVTGNLLPFRGYFVRTFVDGVQVNLRAVAR